MKNKTKTRSAPFWVFFALLAVLTAAALELNKNALAAWAVCIALLALYAFLRQRFLRGGHFYLRLIALLALLALLCQAMWGVGRPYKLRPAVEKSGGMTEVVTLRDGKVQGVLTADGAVEVYTGIPYAKPPVGELRWRAPQDPEPWSGVRTAVNFAPMAMQPRSSEIYNSLSRIVGFHDYEITPDDNFRDAVSEDALYLNLWKPAGASEKLPVLVYIHGGALQTGQPWYGDYSGEGLARKGVLVVNFGYRLGVFGFLANEELAAEDPNGSTGNYGLMDQVKALEWVRDNIAAFGGDPENVTLAGESAGAVCVSALCTSPAAKGLFRRAILESSTVSAPVPQHSFRSMDEALQTGRETLARFGAKDIAELRAMPAEKLVEAADTNHHLTLDGYLLPVTPYEAYRSGVHNEEALLHGFNAEEGTPFILFDQAKLKNYESKVRGYFGEYADEVLRTWAPETNAEARDMWLRLYSAVYFTHGHYCLSRQDIRLGVPVWEYYFAKENGRLSAWHSGEEIYCYHNIPADSKLFDEGDRALSDLFSDYFVNFIRSGDPNGEGLPAWEQSTDGTELMLLSDEQKMIPDPYLEIDALLDRMQGWED
ncbi:MAG: carboxylesterase family protein [Oscillospiraceae bacterium]|nr:carboxylesterase family protein [Oscillospiraceae bacterium]